MINNNHPLFRAVIERNLARVKELVTNNYVNINAVDDLNRTALHIAVEEQNLPIAHFLLESGANPNSFDRNGLTPLHKAAKQGYNAMIEIMIDNGANTRALDDTRLRPIDHAALRGKTSTVKLMLNQQSNYPESINTLCAAIRGGNLDTVEAVLQRVDVKSHIKDLYACYTLTLFAYYIEEISAIFISKDQLNDIGFNWVKYFL